MTTSEKKQLMAAACKVRMGAIKGVHAAKAGHPGGSLSAADLFTYLYFKELRIDPKNPKWEDRDRFVLSKGHTAPGLYAAAGAAGLLPGGGPADAAADRQPSAGPPQHEPDARVWTCPPALWPGCLHGGRHGAGGQVPAKGLPGVHPAGRR